MRGNNGWGGRPPLEGEDGSDVVRGDDMGGEWAVREPPLRGARTGGRGRDGNEIPHFARCVQNDMWEGGMGPRPPSSRGQDLDARTTGGGGRPPLQRGRDGSDVGRGMTSDGNGRFANRPYEGQVRGGGRDGSEIPRLRCAAFGMTCGKGGMGPRMREDKGRGSGDGMGLHPHPNLPSSRGKGGGGIYSMRPAGIPAVVCTTTVSASMSCRPRLSILRPTINTTTGNNGENFTSSRTKARPQPTRDPSDRTTWIPRNRFPAEAL